MTTDAELLTAYATDRSNAAFTELVGRHVDLVYSTAIRLLGGDAHRAEDIAQSVFAILARKAPRLTAHSALEGWLYVTTRREAMRTIRSELRRSVREQIALSLSEAQASDDSNQIRWDEVRLVLDDAMSELGRKDREAVLLRFFSRRGFAEVAAILNLSEDAARMRVQRALERLHTSLGKRGITSTSGAIAAVLSTYAAPATAPAITAAITNAALTAGASSATGFITASLLLMKTANVVATVTTLVAVVAIGFGYRESVDRRLAESERADAMKQVQSLRSASRGTSGVPSMPSPVLAKRNPDDVKNESAGGDGYVTNMLTGSAARATALRNRIMTEPELQQAFVEQVRSNFALRFGPLYRKLNLTPEQILAFETRSAAGQHSNIDLNAVAQAKGVSLNDPSLAPYIAKQKAEYESDIRAILGDAGWAEYMSFERTAEVRQWINPILGNLLYTESPLLPPQLDQLTALVAENSTSYRKGNSARTTDVAWDNVLNEAPRFLTPTQVEALTASVQSARAGQKVQQLINAASRNAAPAKAEPAKPSGA